MEEPVSLDDLKDQLRLDPSRADEDRHLAGLIKSARRTIEREIHHSIVGLAPSLPAEDIPIVRQAILMLAAHWYDVRDGQMEMPPAVAAIVRPLHNWAR